MPEHYASVKMDLCVQIQKEFQDILNLKVLKNYVLCNHFCVNMKNIKYS